jgi:hypothetical protein
MKAIITKVGLDEDGKAWGQNVYTPFFQRVNDFGNTIGQGLKTDIRHLEMQVGYVVNPRTNLRIYAGYVNRSFVNKKTDQQTSFFHVGMATMLRNVYFDF